MYTPSTKFKKKGSIQKPQDISKAVADIYNVGQVVNELNRYKETLISKIESIHQEAKGEKGDQGDPGRSIKGDPGKDGRNGINGKDADESKIISRVLSLIPQPKDGSVGEPGKSVDFEEVFKAFLDAISSGKFKLKRQHIDGLEEYLTTTRNYVARFGGKGGGGGGITMKTLSGAIDGENTSFTVADIPLYIVSDGTTYFEDNGYTRSGFNITMTIAPSQYIRYAI